MLWTLQHVDTSKIKFTGLTNEPKICFWVPATFCNQFKPPVEYEFELRDEEADEERSSIPNNQKPEVKRNKIQDPPERLISSIVNLAIDDKPAETKSGQVPFNSESNSSETKSHENCELEDENEAEDENEVEDEAERERKTSKVNKLKPPRVYGGINLSTVLEIISFIPAVRGIKVLSTVAKVAKRSRAGRTKRIKEILKSPKTSKTEKGWIQQEINQIERGKRRYIRNPPGKDLAHPRGKESAKGHDYSETFFQNKDLHRLQHKHDKMGKLNKPK